MSKKGAEPPDGIQDDALGEWSASAMSLITRVLILASEALITLQCGCSHPRYYADAEYSLATHDHFAAQGHVAVYYPGEIALAFPGYVVGIETSDRSALLHGGDLVVDDLHEFGRTLVRLTSGLREGAPRTESFASAEINRLPFISQVLRYTGRPQGAGNCAVYSLYQAAWPPLMEFCDGRKRPQIDDLSTYRSAFSDSWSAIDALKEALSEDAATGNYTHLIVAMMGWRTPQEEAIRNFNSLVRSTQLAAKGEFRPLFVGITWAGPWAGRWFDPLMEALSYPSMADLADSLGLTWLGVLTEEAVIPLAGRLSVNFVTHSFGARAASMAICIGPAIRRDASDARAPANGSIDRLIGFEAAFSLQRFKDEPLVFWYEDITFPRSCGRAKSVVLTTTAHDTATKFIVWADLAGNYRHFKSFCRTNAGTVVSCASVDETGAIQNEYDASMKVLYLDATKLIRFRAPGTDGGAHSDIFRPPTGRLIWDLISKPPNAAHAAAEGR
ncbi:MAG: hypothetical protein OEW27_08745 [Aquincola sp.]|nr:hypothetical protein [Aquincola sp.]MDH5330027.1 hypothetical protein [Aquincola sp.]